MQFSIVQSDNRSIEGRKIHFIFSAEEISYSAFNKAITVTPVHLNLSKEGAQ